MELTTTREVPISEIITALYSGLSPLTIEARKTDVRHFARWLGQETPEGAAKHLLSLHPGEAMVLVLKYRNESIEAGDAPATVNRRLSTLRQVVKLGRVLGLIFWTLEVPSVKVETYRDTKGPGIEAIRMAFAIFNDFTTSKYNMITQFRATRDRAIVWLLAGCGLRVKEAIAINTNDLDLEGLRIQIMGKGKKAKSWITIPTQARDAIAAWAELTEEVGPGPLFYRLDLVLLPEVRTRMSKNSVRYMTKQLQLGSPHGLRHTAITTGLDLSNNSRAVQRFARHADIKTTMIYDDNREDLAGQVAQKVADHLSSISAETPDQTHIHIEEPS